jgi:hypothetical protein
MRDETALISTSLSTRAKRGLAIDGVHTVAELKRLLDERGERYLREQMFNIGKVTAEEILEFLTRC